MRVPAVAHGDSLIACVARTTRSRRHWSSLVAKGLPITGAPSPYHQPNAHLGPETANREASLRPYPGTQVRKNRDAPSATVAACSPASGSSHTSPA